MDMYRVRPSARVRSGTRPVSSTPVWTTGRMPWEDANPPGPVRPRFQLAEESGRRASRTRRGSPSSPRRSRRDRCRRPWEYRLSTWRGCTWPDLNRPWSPGWKPPPPPPLLTGRSSASSRRPPRRTDARPLLLPAGWMLSCQPALEAGRLLPYLDGQLARYPDAFARRYRPRRVEAPSRNWPGGSRT